MSEMGPMETWLQEHSRFSAGGMAFGPPSMGELRPYLHQQDTERATLEQRVLNGESRIDDLEQRVSVLTAALADIRNTMPRPNGSWDRVVKVQDIISAALTQEEG